MNKFDNKRGVFTTLGMCLISVTLVILFSNTESSKDYSVPSYINTDSAQYLEGVDYEIDRSSSHDIVNSKEDKKIIGNSNEVSSNKISSNSSNIDSSHSNHINGDRCAKCKGNRIYHQVWINDNN